MDMDMSFYSWYTGYKSRVYQQTLGPRGSGASPVQTIQQRRSELQNLGEKIVNETVSVETITRREWRNISQRLIHDHRRILEKDGAEYYKCIGELVMTLAAPYLHIDYRFTGTLLRCALIQHGMLDGTKIKPSLDDRA